MVDFHRLQSVSLIRVHTCLIHDGLVEVLPLVSEDSIICATLHHSEIVGPFASQLKVFLGGRKCARLTLFEGHSRLIHELLYIHVGFFRQAFKFFDLGMLSRSNVCDPGQLIG